MPIRFQRDAIDDKRRYCVKREKNKRRTVKDSDHLEIIAFGKKKEKGKKFKYK